MFYFKQPVGKRYTSLDETTGMPFIQNLVVVCFKNRPSYRQRTPMKVVPFSVSSPTLLFKHANDDYVSQTSCQEQSYVVCQQTHTETMSKQLSLYTRV